MQPRLSTSKRGGFTGWDLLICVVTAALFVGFLLPALVRPKRTKAQRIVCISNLKQVGLAFRMWANEHGEKFPMELSMFGTNTGTMEFNLTGEVWRHFRAISNELNSPRVLICNEDKRRSRAPSWWLFTNNSHLSYFVGLDADETRPQSLLSGDRNLTSNTARPVNGVLSLTASDRVEFTKELHNQVGNVGLGDGSAHQMTTALLGRQFQAVFASTTQAVHRLALPE